MVDDPFKRSDGNEAPFSGSEWSAHREMRRKITDAWPSIEGADNIRRGGAQIAKIVAVVGVIGGAIAFAVQKGVF